MSIITITMKLFNVQHLSVMEVYQYNFHLRWFLVLLPSMMDVRMGNNPGVILVGSSTYIANYPDNLVIHVHRSSPR